MASSPYPWPVRRDTIEEGSAYSPAVFLRSGNGASIGQGQVASWTFKVYDRQSVSEDSAVYSSTVQAPSATNPDGSSILRTAPATDGWAPNPSGYTFRPDLNPGALWSAAGGRTYTVEFEFNLQSNIGFVAKAILRCELNIVPRFG